MVRFNYKCYLVDIYYVIFIPQYSFVVFWIFRNIDIKRFAQCQGYRTENQLGYFKKCADHHKAWDSICNIYRHAMTMELVWPYVVSTPNPCVSGYFDWVKNQKDELYKLKYEQVNCY